MGKFKEAMLFRHACREFDGSKINKKDLRKILDVTRLSPSSFGLEHWKILVIESPELKESLEPLCHGQKQVSTCSELILFFSKKRELKPNSDYVERMFRRRGFSDEEYEHFLQNYKNFYQARIKNDKDLEEWGAKQCYLAAANMITYAAYRGVDSCPLEGFEKTKVEKFLQIDKKDYSLSLMVALGYRKNEPLDKNRLRLKEVIEVL